MWSCADAERLTIEEFDEASRLLRARRKRPCTGQKGDEFASSQGWHGLPPPRAGGFFLSLARRDRPVLWAILNRWCRHDGAAGHRPVTIHVTYAAAVLAIAINQCSVSLLGEGSNKLTVMPTCSDVGMILKPGILARANSR